jgi:hypothetical protein
MCPGVPAALSCADRVQDPFVETTSIEPVPVDVDPGCNPVRATGVGTDSDSVSSVRPETLCPALLARAALGVPSASADKSAARRRRRARLERRGRPAALRGTGRTIAKSIGMAPEIQIVLKNRIKDEAWLVLSEEKGIAIHQRLF